MESQRQRYFSILLRNQPEQAIDYIEHQTEERPRNSLSTSEKCRCAVSDITPKFNSIIAHN